MRKLTNGNPAQELTEAGQVPDEPAYRNAMRLAADTFELIREYQTPPVPKAYEILFSYASKDREVVRGRVDEAVERHGMLNLYDIDQIHFDYFSYPESIQQRQEEATGSMDSELLNLLELIEAHGTATGAYAKTLASASASLSEDGDADQLRLAIKKLLDENERMRRESEDLSMSLEMSRDTITAMRESLESMREEGLRDALTGLHNRRHFDQVLPKEIRRACDEGQPLSLCIADIDHFKSINDTFGHPTGDAVLRFIGSLLSENLKGRDIPVRYGGEEFAIVLPRTPRDVAMKLADHLRQQLADKRLVVSDSGESLGRITASFGIAELLPGEDPSELISRADAKLYTAKRSGRNCVVSDSE
ncbi:MAG: GGDEF domain-containing protein [Paracoccaceae bacterium]